MSAPYIDALGNRICVVVFPTPEDLTVAKSEPLIAELEVACKLAPIALLIEVPPLRTIEPPMVAFIIGAMSSGRVNAPIVGVIAKSAIVRVALRAIQAALKVYGKDIEIGTFDTRALGATWAAERLAALAPK